MPSRLTNSDRLLERAFDTDIYKLATIFLLTPRIQLRKNVAQGPQG